VVGRGGPRSDDLGDRSARPHGPQGAPLARGGDRRGDGWPLLNKGPHIVEVVRFIRNIHERMQPHQVKKMSMLRRLNVSRMR
jgi:hypothetical protein